MVFYCSWQLDSANVWSAREHVLPLQILSVPISVPADNKGPDLRSHILA